MILVVTGGIASGKSFVMNLLAKESFDLIDLDKISHSIMVEDIKVRHDIYKAFPGSLDKDGMINRSLLSEIVFSNYSNIRILNQIIHPIVRLRYEEIIQDYIVSGRDVAIEIPLMIESLFYESYEYYNDYILLIKSSYEDRLKRALSRKGMTKEKFDAIVQAQLPDSTKIQYSDFIIENKDSESLLQEISSIKDRIICQIN